MNILAIGAHPDDIEIGCGGTLIKYAEHGHRVYLMIVTDGERGGKRMIRRREQEAAARLLGAKRIVWGRYQDTEVGVDRRLIQLIERTIAEVEPSLVFIQHGDDTHQDHRHLSTCAVTATRYTRNVLFYEGPTTQHFTPSVFVNIDSVLDRKLEAIRAHDSQILKTNIKGLSMLDAIRSSAHVRGLQGRVRSAEGFMPLRLFINID